MSGAPPRASALLAALFTTHVSAFEAREPIGPTALSATEARHVARASGKRVAEFAAGRACARRALEALGIRGFALEPGPAREPLWPAGIAGSITHTAGFCGAAVARTTAALALGIDAEQREAVRQRLWHRIATAAELRALKALDEADAPARASLLFSAKEAFFKAQFPLTREWLHFHDVTVSIEGASLRFAPQRRLAIEALVPEPWIGRYAFEGTLVVTGLAFPPSRS